MSIRLRDIDLNLLVYLDALIKECHVSRAAERVGVSQPTMSVALARLRELFHDPLLVKGGTRLVATPHALDLQRELQTVLGSIERMVQSQPNFDAASARLTFSVILTDYADLLLLPRLVPELERMAPGVCLNILGPNPKRLGEVLADGSVDAVVTYFPQPPESARSRILFSDRLVVIARRNHPAFVGPGPDVQAFGALRHVRVAPGEANMYTALVDDALARSGVTRTIELSDPHFLAIPFTVAASDLVATMPYRIARRFADIAAIEIHEPPVELPEYNVVLMWHDRTHLLASHQWFRGVIVRLCQELLRG